MSRCFSYPPPGYSVSGGSRVPLIDSIKLQSESVLAKDEAKKQRKRERKEKRKDCKEKLKIITSSEKLCLKFTSGEKLGCNENEQLETSSLTEEHARPVAREQKPSTSSDSTQNSSKRKRETSPAEVVKQDGNSIRSNGNVIRIRLSSRKKNAVVSQQEPCSTTTSLHEQDAALSRQLPCSTSGRAELVSRNNHQEREVDFSSIQQGSNNVISVRPPRPQVDKVCSALIPISVNRGGAAPVLSQLPENKLPVVALPPRPDGQGCSALSVKKQVTADDDIPVRDPKSLDKKKVRAELRYNDLFLNLLPSSLQTEMESDEQDWLFSKKSKNLNNAIEKKLQPGNNVACGSSSSFWPRAQFVPEADIYALPFTVPF